MSLQGSINTATTLKGLCWCSQTLRDSRAGSQGRHKHSAGCWGGWRSCLAMLSCQLWVFSTKGPLCKQGWLKSHHVSAIRYLTARWAGPYWAWLALLAAAPKSKPEPGKRSLPRLGSTPHFGSADSILSFCLPGQHWALTTCQSLSYSCHKPPKQHILVNHLQMWPTAPQQFLPWISPKGPAQPLTIWCHAGRGPGSIWQAPLARDLHKITIWTQGQRKNNGVQRISDYLLPGPHHTHSLMHNLSAWWFSHTSLFSFC